MGIDLASITLREERFFCCHARSRGCPEARIEPVINEGSELCLRLGTCLKNQRRVGFLLPNGVKVVGGEIAFVVLLGNQRGPLIGQGNDQVLSGFGSQGYGAGVIQSVVENCRVAQSAITA